MRQPRLLAGMAALIAADNPPQMHRSNAKATVAPVKVTNGFLTKGGRAAGAAPRVRLLVETFCTEDEMRGGGDLRFGRGACRPWLRTARVRKER
jgi:hypothetical protein